MITDEQAEKAADYIRDHASQFAQAKANRVQLEHFRQSQLAILFNSFDGGVAERENRARAHPDYIAVLNGIKAATEAEETLRWMMEAARLKVELWRTQSANDRKG